MTAGEFDGLAALVTGGASGIGQATAQHLAARGARVMILDRDNPRPDATSAATARAVIADVTDDAAVRPAVGAAAAALGGIDILVNNAGIGAVGTVEGNDDPEWHRVFDVNVFGMVRASRAALPHLRRAAQRRGRRSSSTPAPSRPAPAFRSVRCTRRARARSTR